MTQPDNTTPGQAPEVPEHPLARFTDGIKDWFHWLEIWNSTTSVEIAHSLIACGFKVSSGTRNIWDENTKTHVMRIEAPGERVTFYLSVADNYRGHRKFVHETSPLYSLGEPEISSGYGKTTLREIHGKIARRALKEVLNSLNHGYSRDGELNWRRLIKHEMTWRKILWFCDPKQDNLGETWEAEDDEEMRNLQTLILEMITFALKYPFDRASQSDRGIAVAKIFRETRLVMFEILHHLCETRVLLRMDVGTESNVTKLLRQILFADTHWIGGVQTREMRAFKNLREALGVGSSTAQTIHVLEIRAEDDRRQKQSEAARAEISKRKQKAHELKKARYVEKTARKEAEKLKRELKK